jgi:large conductance mechanosensitive channel
MSEKNYSSSQERAFINSSDLEGYKKFAFKDDMLKLSVCFIIGNSFNKVVCGISDYLIMPITTYLVSSTGTHWREMTVTPLSGMSIELGRLAGVFVDFFMVSIILYMIYIKLLGRLVRRNSEPVQKRCPNCMSMIHAEAKRCPMCTGRLIVEKRRAGSKDKGTKDA